METDAPSTGPAPAIDAPRDRRRGGVLGLPARLAFLTLLATAACVAGIAVFADQRIHDAAEAAASQAGTVAARDVAGKLTEADFQPGDADLERQLVERLEDLRLSEPAIRSITLLRTTRGGKLEPVAVTTGADVDASRTMGRRVVRSDADAFELVGTAGRARVARAFLFSDGRTGGIIAVEYSAAEVAGGARDARRRLALGATLGGSLLALLLLVTLRRELFRPLEEMRRVMAQIRGGASGVRIGWSRGDELGAVADDFDATVAELERIQAELAKYVNRDPLTGLLTRDAFVDRFSGELTRARREGYPISLLAIDVDELAEINRTHDDAAGDQVLAALGEVIDGCTRPTDACGRTGDDSFHVALVGADAAQAAVVIERIRREVAQRVGIGPERTRVTCGFGVAEYPTHAVDQLALERMASAACEHAQRGGRDQALAFGPAGGYVDVASLVPEEHRQADRPAGQRELSTTVHALARALDGIDPVLGGGAHSQRVARYAAAVARELGMSDAELGELRSAAVLHDVGKVAVPASLLRMPERELDERQRGALRYHAWVSRTMIAGAGMPGVAEVVFRLPERWDGTGYPERAREEEIPLASRILHAAELLDDLTSGDGTRTPMDAVAAAAELKRRAGTQLDPDVAVRLARLVREEGLLGAAPDEDLADAA